MHCPFEAHLYRERGRDHVRVVSSSSITVSLSLKMRATPGNGVRFIMFMSAQRSASGALELQTTRIRIGGQVDQTTPPPIARVRRYLLPEKVEGLPQQNYHIISLWRLEQTTGRSPSATSTAWIAAATSSRTHSNTRTATERRTACSGKRAIGGNTCTG